LTVVTRASRDRGVDTIMFDPTDEVIE